MGPGGQAAWAARRPPMTMDQANRRSQSPLLEPWSCKLLLQAAAARCKLTSILPSLPLETPKPTNKKTAATTISNPASDPIALSHASKDLMVMWPCRADPRSRKWLLQQMSEKGPLSFLCPFPSRFPRMKKKQTMQSFPCQPAPAQAPCNLVHAHTHTQAPRKPSTVAWHLRAEKPKEDFPVIDLGFPPLFWLLQPSRNCRQNTLAALSPAG